MAMSKKDFAGLAEIVRNFSLDETDSQDNGTILAKALADFCIKQNPRFDRARFLQACGVSDENEN